MNDFEFPKLQSLLKSTTLKQIKQLTHKNYLKA